MLATKYSLPTVDLFAAFTGHPELFIQPPMKDSDGEHTSDAGSTKIAQLVAAAITGTAVTPTPAGDAGVPATGSGGRPGNPGGGGAKGPPAGGSGGATGTGGADGTGGATTTGPSIGSGGATVTSSGGAPVVVSGSGGATVGFTSGGSTGSFGSGGALGAAGDTGVAATPSSSSSGCACSMDAGPGSRRGAGLLTSVALVGLGLVLRRKRGR
jgi:MYXO-CTERM domain-containing protein